MREALLQNATQLRSMRVATCTCGDGTYLEEYGAVDPIVEPDRGGAVKATG